MSLASLARATARSGPARPRLLRPVHRLASRTSEKRGAYVLYVRCQSPEQELDDGERREGDWRVQLCQRLTRLRVRVTWPAPRFIHFIATCRVFLPPSSSPAQTAGSIICVYLRAASHISITEISTEIVSELGGDQDGNERHLQTCTASSPSFYRDATDLLIATLQYALVVPASSL